jgi:hypothetical protein
MGGTQPEQTEGDACVIVNLRAVGVVPSAAPTENADRGCCA